MDLGGPYNYNRGPQPPRPPNPFFDGTRLGLEGNMVVTLGVAVPAGLHIALSAILGYAVRYEDLAGVEPRTFAVFGFILASLLAVIGMAMLLFFILSIPTMAYSMLLVVIMLRWVGRRLPREKLSSAIIGGVMGLLLGIGSSAVVFLLTDLTPAPALYAELLRWPAVMTIDAIVLIWFSLNPLLNAAAGAQIGWRLGKMLEELSLYYW